MLVLTTFRYFWGYCIVIVFGCILFCEIIIENRESSSTELYLGWADSGIKRGSKQETEVSLKPSCQWAHGYRGVGEEKKNEFAVLSTAHSVTVQLFFNFTMSAPTEDILEVDPRAEEMRGACSEEKEAFMKCFRFVCVWVCRPFLILIHACPLRTYLQVGIAVSWGGGEWTSLN